MKDEFIQDVITGELSCYLTREAILFRKSHDWLHPITRGGKARGVAIAYNTHDDSWGYQYGDVASGEIEWI